MAHAAEHGVDHTTGVVAMPDGTELFEQAWRCREPKAHVLIIHGYGEHSSRYPHVAERLNAEDFSVYTYDQRNHGKSPGRKGYVPDFGNLVDDLDVFVKRVQGGAGSAPVFLFGHSMGGLVLAAYAIRYKPDVKGLVFSAAGVKAPKTSVVERTAAKILSVVLPHAPVHDLDTAGLSRIEEVETRYKADPLVYQGKMGARTITQMVGTMDEVQARLGEITLPLIALHGTADRLVGYQASESIQEKAGSKDKTLNIYEGAYHEMFNDLGADHFMDDLMDWLKARV